MYVKIVWLVGVLRSNVVVHSNINFAALLKEVTLLIFFPVEEFECFGVNLVSFVSNSKNGFARGRFIDTMFG